MDIKKNLSPLIILIVCLILIFVWFNKGLLFAGGEGGIPFYNLSKTAERISYLWIDEEAGYPGVGNLTEVPYYALLKIPLQFGVPSNLVQAFHFFLVMFTGVVSVYFLIKITIEEELKKNLNFWGAKYISLIGAIFYLLNPFSMSQVFGRSLNIQYLSFVLLPLFLLLYIRGLKTRNLIYGFLSLIPSFIFSGAYGSFGYIPALWFLVFLYTVFYLWKNRSKREIIFGIFFLSFVFLSWIMVNLFWIIPVFKLGGQQLAASLNATEENLGSLRGVSKHFSLPILIRLLHTGYFYEDLYGIVYSSLFFVIISWIIPVVSFFSLTLFKKVTSFKFYLTLFVISLFISLGSNFPTGWLFEFIFEAVPAFQMYRNPYEKFGLIFLLAYTPFFALGTLVLSEKLAAFFKHQRLKYFWVVLILFLVSGIFVWPMWKGIFAGGYRINTWINVPDYYKNANDWLNQQDGDFRLLHLPLIPGDGIRYKWDHPYQGIEPSEFLFDRASIAQNIPFNKQYYNVLLQRIGIFQPNIFGSDPDLTNSEFKSEKLGEELAKLNIRYIVLHNDIDVSFGGFKTPQETAVYLAKDKKIIKVKSFGQLDIYEVEIPQNIQIIYSPSTTLIYEKINPAFYKVKVTDEVKPFNLNFLMSYNSNWHAVIDGEVIQDHVKLFSYGNSWEVNKTGSFEIDLVYKPQELVKQGQIISTFSFIVISLLMVCYQIIWKKRI